MWCDGWWWAVPVLVLVILVAIWGLLVTAPTVDPDRCIFDDIRSGGMDCGGPCTSERPLPCEEGGAHGRS